MDRTSHGVLLGGRVTAINQDQSMFRSEIQLYGRERTMMTVASRVDPRQNSRATYDVGDEVMILGAFVLDPTESARSFPLVWGGLAVAIEAAR